MQISDISNPSERKKLIWAIVLGVVALVFLWWTFFGFGGGSPPSNARNTANPRLSDSGPTVRQAAVQKDDELQTSELKLQPVSYKIVLPFAQEPRRNIFVYYEKPPPVATIQTPTPTPTPPVLLATVSPSNVYAGTGEFKLEVTGDKFTPEIRIAVDGRDLQTQFSGPQQLSTTVPASMISNAGSRQVIVRSADGKLYSNAAMLNVNAPPSPNYNYIGIIKPTRQPETALLLDKGSREVLNVQRGDVLGGRFRLTSISEKELVFVDTNLKIKHTLAFSTERDRGIGPQSRPTPRVDSEDDEP